MTTQANPSSDAEDAATEREDSRRRVQAGREFESHFVAYLMVNAVLVAVWVVTGAGYFWPGWVIAAWGAALVLYDGYVYLANALRRPNERSRRSVHRRRRRARHITQAFARHGLGWLIGPRLGRHLVPWRRHRWARASRSAPRTRPQHLRLVLEELGPTFVKLGQIASTRADLLSPEYQAELARLQDAAPAEPWPTIRAALISELGPRLPLVDPVPLAAGSIGQAHAGVLRDGAEVVIKVRRPGVTALVADDLALIENMAAKTARRLPIAARYDLPALADQFGTTLRQELDYVAELANAAQFAANFTGDPTVRIPRAFKGLSTSRVLTLERLRGIKIDDLAGLDEAGIDRAELARHAAVVILQMVFRDGFFHADPHPGNFFIQPDGAIGLIDFGMVGKIDLATRQRLLTALVAIGTGDGGALVDALVSLGLAGRNVDRPKLSGDLSKLFHEQLARPIAEIALGELLGQVFGVVRHHHLVLPAQLALLLKTIVMWEGLGAQLDPSFRLLDAITAFTGNSIIAQAGLE